MSLIDDLMGRGGIDSTFTDWNEARNFVIFETIVNNPRFDDATNIALQDMETEAYKATYGQFFASEETEIAQYFQYLRNNFPSITDDERFLSIYQVSVEVKADEPSIGFDDIEIPEGVSSVGKKVLIGAGVYALILLLLGT